MENERDFVFDLRYIDVWVSIFRYLEVIDLAMISRACKLFNQLSQRSLVVESVCFNQWYWLSRRERESLKFHSSELQIRLGMIDFYEKRIAMLDPKAKLSDFALITKLGKTTRSVITEISSPTGAHFVVKAFQSTSPIKKRMRALLNLQKMEPFIPPSHFLFSDKLHLGYTHYVVMKKLKLWKKFPTLDAFIRSEKVLSISDIRFFSAQMIFILKVLLDYNVIPSVELENFMISDTGYLKIGTPIQFLAPIELNNIVEEKPFDYYAPEQLKEGMRISISSTFWSLGVSLYQLATGRFPFSEKNVNFQTILNRIEKADFEIPENFDPDFTDLIRRLLVADYKVRIHDPILLMKHKFFQNFDWEINWKREKPSTFPINSYED